MVTTGRQKLRPSGDATPWCVAGRETAVGASFRLQDEDRAYVWLPERHDCNSRRGFEPRARLASPARSTTVPDGSGRDLYTSWVGPPG